MQFGVFLPPFAEFAEPKRVVALSQQLEDSGWDGLFLWDHVLTTPGMAVADPWVTMAAVATVTQRIRLGALVTPLPRRRPWVLSRQLATLDQLSDGRLIGGIGLGGDGWSEFSAFGEPVDPVVRGRMLDEALELVQRFLTGETVNFHGNHYVVDSPATPAKATPEPAAHLGRRSVAESQAPCADCEARRLLPDLRLIRWPAAARPFGHRGAPHPTRRPWRPLRYRHRGGM